MQQDMAHASSPQNTSLPDLMARLTTDQSTAYVDLSDLLSQVLMERLTMFTSTVRIDYVHTHTHTERERHTHTCAPPLDLHVPLTVW